MYCIAPLCNFQTPFLLVITPVATVHQVVHPSQIGCTSSFQTYNNQSHDRKCTQVRFPSTALCALIDKHISSNVGLPSDSSCLALLVFAAFSRFKIFAQSLVLILLNPFSQFQLQSVSQLASQIHKRSHLLSPHQLRS